MPLPVCKVIVRALNPQVTKEETSLKVLKEPSSLGIHNLVVLVQQHVLETSQEVKMVSKVI